MTRRSGQPLLLVNHRTSHHAKTGGYATLSTHLAGEVITAEDIRTPFRLRRFLTRWATGHTYNSTSAGKELELIKPVLSHTARGLRGTVFYLNGEHDLGIASRVSSYLGWRTVATFHKPPSELVRNYPPRSLSYLHGAIAVGTNQIGTLAEMLGHDRIKFIPHGIDTHFFTPSPFRQVEQRKCLFVGQHYRDFDTLAHVGIALAERFPDFSIDVLVSPEFAGRIPQQPWLRLLPYVSDEELRALYRSASCLLLPLIDATACNSIVESLACGTPVVSTNVGGVTDYLDDSCGTLCRPGDVAGMADAVSRLFLNTTLRESKGRAAHAWAQNFSWEAVAASSNEFFEELTDVERRSSRTPSRALS